MSYMKTGKLNALLVIESLKDFKGLPIDIEAEDVSGCLDQLGGRFPKLKERLWDENGQIHRYINVYVNGDDIRFLQQLSTPLGAGDEVSIIPAVAGG